MIVGKFVGEEALAAVGTAGPIMNMIILFISGMCMGAGILMSTQYGARRYDRLRRQISTTLLGGLAFSAGDRPDPDPGRQAAACSFAGAGGYPGGVVLYLRIIFTGLLFTFVYNFFSNTLRALGDSVAARFIF